ncbi:unnamed protein product [Brassica oleracea]
MRERSTWTIGVRALSSFLFEGTISIPSSSDVLQTFGISFEG